ncbi:MAG: glycosyltransferase family 39 protein [Candidatus Harrisonbacteria bacterium]|nr:glycosyltransferase family 39 protein [Candidatus Harrisonbacteria bacterium]
MRKIRIILFGILILAFLLRFWGVWGQDLFGDEAVDAFRAIGYVDYLGTSFQTTPLEWYKSQPLPWWSKLSFHDLPPLGILIMNFFFRVFGDSLLVARLPAIIVGVLSAYLLYLIVKKLFEDEALALFSALFFAVNGALVWVFRLSMLEPILLFFILLNIHLFLQFLENKRKWWLWGISLGLVALTKYTGVFIVPVYLTYWTYKTIRTDWAYLFAALILALLMFSPVLVYNFYLYQTTGHFDLQFAYVFGQETPEWTGSVGKTQAPFPDLWRNLAVQRWDAKTNSIFPVGYYGISAMLAILAGIVYSIFVFAKNRSKGILFFWLYIFFLTLLLVKIGSAHRFLTLYGPAFAVFVGFLSAALWSFKKSKWSYALKALMIGFFAWEIIHSINTNFIRYPDYGMAKLDRYFEEEFAGKESAVIPESDNSHLNDLTYKFALRKSKNADRELRMIVYNDNVALPTLEWIFYRRFFYHSTPALYLENFYKALNSGQDYGKFQFYFVQSTENTILNPFKKDKTIALKFESYLLSKGLQPEKIIYGKNGLPMFRVYKFTIFDI